MKDLVEKIQQLRPVRAFQHYATRNGAVYVESMTLAAFFSIFAGLFIAFAIFMQVLGDNTELRDTLIESISAQVPGLINTDGSGVINPQQLIESRIVGIAGIVAAVGILLTATRWINISRIGFREMLELPSPKSNFVVLKLTDLLVAGGIGLLILTSSGTLIVTQGLADLLGLGFTSTLIGIVIQLALDTATVLLMYRFAGRIRLPIKHLAAAAFACAIGFAILKLFASMLFGSIENNPLLASIASVFVILIWLRFVHQIYLVALAYVAVGSLGNRYSATAQALAREREEEQEKMGKQETVRERELTRVRKELDELNARDTDPKAILKTIRKGTKKQEREVRR